LPLFAGEAIRFISLKETDDWQKTNRGAIRRLAYS
jgi:hypothetical protein